MLSFLLFSVLVILMDPNWWSHTQARRACPKLRLLRQGI
jgi:hypothetical protein